jgi:hypothetical protein
MSIRVILAGDAHGNTGYMITLINRAENAMADRVFVLGDFGYWEHTQDGIEFLNDVNKYARRSNVTVYFLDGNHDKTNLLLEKYGNNKDDEGFLIVRPWIRYAPRGHRWTWGATKFAAFGGAYSVDKAWRLDQERKRSLTIERMNAFREPGNQLSLDTSGTLWFPEEEMTDADMERFLEDRNRVDIILAHDKPVASTPRWNRKDIEACQPNARRLQRAVVTLKPKLFFHGHLHYYYRDAIRAGNDGIFTKVIGLDCDDTSDRTNSFYTLDLPLTV